MAKEVLSCGCEIKLKRDKLMCSKCRNLACPKHTFSRVDESNRAITKNAHLFCVNCLPHLTMRATDAEDSAASQAVSNADNLSTLDGEAVPTRRS